MADKHKIFVTGDHLHKDYYGVEAQLVNYCTPFGYRRGDIHLLTGNNFGTELAVQALAYNQQIEVTVYERDREQFTFEKDKKRLNSIIKECDGVLVFLPTDKDAKELRYVMKEAKRLGKHVHTCGVSVIASTNNF